jgi:hypothetical protein
MASTPNTIERGRPLEQTLRAVRRRIRTYVAVEGLAWVVAIACLAFWLALAADWMFEPASRVRLAFVVACVAAIVVTFYRSFLRRAFAHIADRNVALLLERRFRTLDDSLLTAIDDPQRNSTKRGTAATGAAISSPNRAMLDATGRQAREKLADARLGELFDPLPRRRAIVTAILLVGSIAGYATALPTLFTLGVERLVGRTDELYPRRTKLEVGRMVNNEIVPFKDGEITIAKGSDVDLVVRADASEKMVVPSTIRLYYEPEDGSVDVEEVILDKEGVAKRGNDEFQRYKTSLHGIASTLELDIRGGDARLRNLRIRVVEKPQITMRLRCKFPPYMRRADDLPIAVTGTMPLPLGTLVTVEAEANKPLKRAVVERPDSKGVVTSQELNLEVDGKPVTEFRFDLGRLDSDVAAVIHLYDADGISDTAKLAFQATVDGPPTFKDLARNGIDTSVTAQARLPLIGKIADDYGLSRIWFEYTLDGVEPQDRPAIASRPLASEPTRDVVLDEAVEVSDITPGGASAPLAPGRTLTLVLKAQDNRNLPDQPAGNVAAGDSFAFTIVSDTDLVRLLEGREIMFREQFKSLIEKVTRDRDSLVEIGKAPAASKDGDADESPRNRDKIIVDQARSHTLENRQETLTVSTGFNGIVAELRNNRIPDSDNLKDRLTDDIAIPLKLIAENKFPAYHEKLTALQLLVDKTTKDSAAIEEARREALRAADGILVDMNVVLNKMLELESFKEAVDLLRSIIALQKEIGEQTDAARKDKARLLE